MNENFPEISPDFLLLPLEMEFDSRSETSSISESTYQRSEVSSIADTASTASTQHTRGSAVFESTHFADAQTTENAMQNAAVEHLPFGTRRLPDGRIVRKADLFNRKDHREVDQHNNTVMADKFLRQLCREHNGYSTPSLNDTLYLHFKGAPVMSRE